MVLERIIEGEDWEVMRKKRRLAKATCPAWAAPCCRLLDSPRKVTALLCVAVALKQSDSGFLSFLDATKIAGCLFQGGATPLGSSNHLEIFF